MKWRQSVIHVAVPLITRIDSPRRGVYTAQNTSKKNKKLSSLLSSLARAFTLSALILAPVKSMNLVQLSKPSFIVQMPATAPSMSEILRVIMEPTHTAAQSQIHLSLPADLGLAAFLWEESLWVFIPQQILFVSRKPESASALIQEMRQIRTPQGTFVRLLLKHQMVQPHIIAQPQGAHNLWTLTLLPRTQALTLTLPPPDAPSDVLISGVKAAETCRFLLPHTAHPALVIPFHAGSAQVGNPAFSGASILPSAYGLALLPQNTKISAVSQPGGLRLRHQATPQNAHAPAKSTPTAPLFAPFLHQAAVGPEALAPTRRQLEAHLYRLPRDQRAPARQALAAFYLRHHLYREARGLLEIGFTQDPALRHDPQWLALLGSALFLSEHYEAAAQIFQAPLLEEYPEIGLWRAACRALISPERFALDLARPYFQDLDAYPPVLKNALILALVQGALYHGQVDPWLRQRLESGIFRRSQNPRCAFLLAQCALFENKTDEALARLSELARSQGSSQVYAKARFLHLSLQAQHHQMPRDEQIKTLEKLRYDWKGDVLEFQVLQRLGTLYAEGKSQEDLTKALAVLAQAISRFPLPAQDAHLQATGEEIFHRAFTHISANTHLLESFGLYQRYRAFLPPAPARHAIRLKLVAHLRQAQLLHQAAILLEENLSELEADPPARVAQENQLSEIYLALAQPDKALAALITRPPEGPPAYQRMHLQAQAFVALSKENEMRALASKLSEEDASAYLSALYQRTQNWPRLAQVLSHRVALTKDPQDILNLAIAYFFQGREREVKALRQAYRTVMAKTPLEEVFHLVTAADFTPDVTSKQSILRHMQESDTIEKLFHQYRTGAPASE